MWHPDLTAEIARHRAIGMTPMQALVPVIGIDVDVRSVERLAARTRHRAGGVRCPAHCPECRRLKRLAAWWEQQMSVLARDLAEHSGIEYHVTYTYDLCRMLACREPRRVLRLPAFVRRWRAEDELAALIALRYTWQRIWALFAAPGAAAAYWRPHFERPERSGDRLARLRSALAGAVA